MTDEDFFATNVDKDGLRKLYRTDGTAKAVFDHLARRQRNKTETPVDRLMQNISGEGFDISRPALTAVLKALERARCGEYVVGRKGHPSRFRWDVGMVAAARYAAGEATVIEAVDQATSDDADDSATYGAHDLVNGATPQLTHGFQLRPDLRLSFTLPSDLTPAEATRLADFVKTLPF
jgi:hypothetical protein